MSGAARKARKKAGIKFERKAKTPTIRYTPTGERVRGVPTDLTMDQWVAMMGVAGKIRARWEAEIRDRQFHAVAEGNRVHAEAKAGISEYSTPIN